MSEPRLAELAAGVDREELGAELHAAIADLFPICRSITGPGLRRTLDWIGERIDLERHEVASGTGVFDWEVPVEWTPREAWIEGPDGKRVVDFADHTLHLVGYSAPVDATLPLAELQPHLHSLPEQPGLIPYRTSYYHETWGFCLADEVRQALPEGDYRVLVDSELAPGHISYGELSLPGESSREVLVSSHLCHPSLANDNLSGVVVAVAAARLLASARRRLSYRFLFAPGTIGAITWLARNEAHTALLDAVLVLACLGDPGPFHYKKSRRGDAAVDRAVAHVLRHSGEPYEVRGFTPYGYDERQYCSPGFDLAAGQLSRTPHGRFPEYHTSADDLELVTPGALAGSVVRLLEILAVLDGNETLVSTNPRCEPQLGRRGLYATLGGGGDGRARQNAMLWVLNLADGEHDLLAVAERSGLPFARVREAADALAAADLLRSPEP